MLLFSAGLFFAALLAGGTSAQDEVTTGSPHPLAGWWLSVDDFWPSFRGSAGMTTFEELLIVHDDGTVESRAMVFYSASAEDCAGTPSLCSDAPLIATAMLVQNESTLAFTNQQDGTAALFGGDAELDRQARQLAVSRAGPWVLSDPSGGLSLSLTTPDGQLARNLIRISPTLLKRLRAGIMVAGVSARDRWRCYLQRASGGRDAAGIAVPGKLIDGYLRVASYVLALHAASLEPPPGSEASQASVIQTREWLMVESFDDIRRPSSAAGRDALSDRLDRLVRPDADASEVPFTRAELDAFAAIISHGEDARRLFCLE